MITKFLLYILSFRCPRCGKFHRFRYRRCIECINQEADRYFRIHRAKHLARIVLLTDLIEFGLFAGDYATLIKLHGTTGVIFDTMPKVVFMVARGHYMIEFCDLVQLEESENES